MSRIVRKYGGSSLREPEQIRAVARHIAGLKREGHEVVVVVSAMAATTDEFITLARHLHPNPPRREMDMLLSVGERVSCSLLAMALDAEGVKAVSYTGSQVGIITDTEHGEAHIVDVRPTRLLEALARDQVVVVAGFQGVSIQKEITTLGRGGSDATAIALAAAIGAVRCELMKDVDGIFSADPKVVQEATLLREMDYEAALSMAQGGSTVLQSEAARLARDQQVPLRIGRTQTDEVGTIVTDRPYSRPAIVGIARRDDLVEVRGQGDAPEGEAWVRLVRNDGGYIGWLAAPPGERGEMSGLTIVRGRGAAFGLHGCVVRALQEQVRLKGIVASGSELWIGLPTADAAVAQRILHQEFVERGWLASQPAPEGGEHGRERERDP